MAEKTTVIGEKTKVSGNLEGDEDLLVKGRVEGNIKLSKTLHVESGGIVVADVDVKDCVLAGVVVGDITASDSVHITNGGRMVGDIKAPRVIIVSGAAFRGRVDMGDMESERSERPRKQKIEVEDRTPASKKPGKEEKPAAAIAGMDFGGRKPPAVTNRPAARAAVAPRVASAGGGKQPAPPAPPLPGGKRALKKK
jgi:cytoskeletal protein CcmA (bactofilin family)